ncbi:hypothetical protein A9Q73_08495 [Bermanella sp. 47_1433_sub80_T6]|nr:hypothetical protein A9Q73_08495 [Bermanella sp. 47_1433_sub80_T6]
MDNLRSTDEQQIKNIQSAVRLADARWKSRFPLLNHQDALGMIILLVSLAGMVSSGLAYLADLIPAWSCILITAFFAGVSHELEHDLIHRLYFRKNALVHNFMMLTVWIMRPNTVNPWYRRGIHFNHHKVSGTAEDIEERVLGNGMKFGWKRIITSLDGFLSISVRRKELTEMKLFNYIPFVLKGAPLAHIYIVSLYALLAIHGFQMVAQFMDFQYTYPAWISQIIDGLNILAVVWVLPNTLRAFSLHTVTSMLHYYGDVDSLIKQCQVMNHWALAPLNLFCFNFGSTHVIHHLVVSQPFYLRQLVAKEIHQVMKENGIRFNDFGSVLRANRYNKIPAVEPLMAKTV